MNFLIKNHPKVFFAAVAIFVVFLYPKSLKAEGTESNTQIDSVLDRLERRLIDQDKDVLNFGDEAEEDASTPKEKGTVTKYKYPKSKITSSTSEQDKLKALGTAISELENQVDKLASNVQKTKQTILDDSGIDNFIALEAHLDDTDASSLKTLIVKLDGYAVYEMQEASGLWMPSKIVPLYSGPMQPGAHRIEIEARLVMRHKQAVPLNSDVYRFVNKSFDLNIPGGVVNSRYIIAIKPPEKIDGTASATMKEAI